MKVLVAPLQLCQTINPSRSAAGLVKKLLLRTASVIQPNFSMKSSNRYEAAQLQSRLSK
jgi:hypothetical protein